MKRLPLLLTAMLLSGAAFAQTATPPPERRMDPEQMHGPWRERAEHKFNEADSNHDGNLSQSEWQSARLRESNEMFQKFDSNRDGKLSRTEMQQGRGERMHGRGDRGGRMKALDTDGDQQLSRAEIGDKLPRLAANFDRLDANRDGKLSRDEIRAGRDRDDGDRYGRDGDAANPVD
jgi:Ca2+-binding EF-hand superfamily protein